LEGRLKIGEISVAEIRCGWDDRVVELRRLYGWLVRIFDIGRGVVAGFGRVHDIGPGDKAFGVGIGDEVGDVGIVILVKVGVVGVEVVFLGVVERHVVGLGGRPGALELVVHA
jgi:hypothetical protein